MKRVSHDLERPDEPGAQAVAHPQLQHPDHDTGHAQQQPRHADIVQIVAHTNGGLDQAA